MGLPPISADLLFVHLSDLHFREGQTGDAYDLDADLRNEIEMDLRRLRSEIPRFDGILVTGDIAFSGKASEYAAAGSWFKRLCELLECPEENVMMVPGNHDVDRSVLAGHPEIGVLHAKLRACTLDRVDDELHQILRSDEGETLLSPLAAYNAFAQKYGCDLTPSRPFWERPFKLSNGVALRIRGLNTTYVSGPGDDQCDKQLIGKAQATVHRADDVETAVLGHHPPSWMLDQEAFEAAASTRARLQLFGHRHEQWCWPTANGVAVIGGAVHPPPREKSMPRYNLLSMTVSSSPAGRAFAVVIYPRRWTTEESCFMADYNSRADPTRTYTFPLPAVAKSAISVVVAEPEPKYGTVVLDTVDDPSDARGRRLAFRLQVLPHELQLRVGSSLSIPVPATSVPDREYIRSLLAAAGTSGRLAEIWSTVEQFHGAANLSENPFVPK